MYFCCDLFSRYSQTHKLIKYLSFWNPNNKLTGLLITVWKSSPPCMERSSRCLPPGYRSRSSVCVNSPQVCRGNTITSLCLNPRLNLWKKENIQIKVFWEWPIWKIATVLNEGQRLKSGVSCMEIQERKKIHLFGT